LKKRTGFRRQLKNVLLRGVCSGQRMSRTLYPVRVAKALAMASDSALCVDPEKDGPDPGQPYGVEMFEIGRGGNSNDR
jgi:hypothetical protein